MRRRRTRAAWLRHLPGHPVSGEERFAVRCDPATSVVFAEVLSFSCPATGEQSCRAAGRAALHRPALPARCEAPTPWLRPPRCLSAVHACASRASAIAPTSKTGRAAMSQVPGPGEAENRSGRQAAATQAPMARRDRNQYAGHYLRLP